MISDLQIKSIRDLDKDEWKDVYTAAQDAQILGCHKNKIVCSFEKGWLKGWKKGKYWRIDGQSLKEKFQKELLNQLA